SRALGSAARPHQPVAQAVAGTRTVRDACGLRAGGGTAIADPVEWTTPVDQLPASGRTGRTRLAAPLVGRGTVALAGRTPQRSRGETRRRPCRTDPCRRCRESGAGAHDPPQQGAPVRSRLCALPLFDALAEPEGIDAAQRSGELARRHPGAHRYRRATVVRTRASPSRGTVRREPASGLCCTYPCAASGVVCL